MIDMKVELLAAERQAREARAELRQLRKRCGEIRHKLVTRGIRRPTLNGPDGFNIEYTAQFLRDEIVGPLADMAKGGK